MIRISWPLVFKGEATDSLHRGLSLTCNSNLELLRAAKKYSTSLKHFTYTGSMVTVYDVTKPLGGRVLKSTDWNPVCRPYEFDFGVEMVHSCTEIGER